MSAPAQKALAGARKDDDAHRVIGVGLAEGGDDLFAHPRGKGVELGRTVERDCRNRTVTRIEKRFKSHRHVSCAGCCHFA